MITIFIADMIARLQKSSRVNFLSQVQSGRSKRVQVDSRANVDGLEPNWFHLFGPSSFIPLNRLLLSIETVKNHFFRSYSLFSKDRPPTQTFQFQSFRPFSLTPRDRPLRPKTVHFRLDPISYTKIFHVITVRYEK